jgi:large subunit ribosomal protein L4
MPLSLIRSMDGSVIGSVRLDETIFGIQPNVPVLHQVVAAQRAAARSGTQSTKTRAEVSGGGRKPFKQKGTGRARQGSDRAPQFTGGGVALGPKPRSYRQRTPRKMIQLALRSALSDRASADKVVVVEPWPWDVPSTRQARGFLDALDLAGKVLLVLGSTDEDAYKSFRNLPGVQLLMAGELNAYDILCNDWIVFTRQTLPGEVVDVTERAGAGEDAAGGDETTEASGSADGLPVATAAADEAAGGETAGEQLPADAIADDGPSAPSGSAHDAEPAAPSGPTSHDEEAAPSGLTSEDPAAGSAAEPEESGNE